MKFSKDSKIELAKKIDYTLQDREKEIFKGLEIAEEEIVTKFFDITDEEKEMLV